MKAFVSHVRFLFLALSMPVLLAGTVRAHTHAALLAASPVAPEIRDSKVEARNSNLESRTSKPGDDIMLTGDRLLTEERRQSDVSRRLSGVYRRFVTLLDDVQSNELGEKGGAAALVQTGKGVEVLRDKRVPVASNLLNKARADLSKALPHVDGADKEIEGIITDFNKLIAGAGSILTDDRLLKEIRGIIKEEEFLRGRTAEWGRKLILTPEAGTLDQGRVSRAQQVAIDRYIQFFEKLTAARKEAVDMATVRRFGNAEHVLAEGKPAARLAAAIDQVTQNKAIGAVSEQDQALVVLRKAERILSEGAVSDLGSELARILAAEKDLYENTKQSEATEFPKEKSHLEARQIGIGTMLETAIKNFLPSLAEKLTNPAAPPTIAPPIPTPRTISDELTASLTAATKAVAVAVTELNAGRQAPAVAAELAVIKALELAIYDFGHRDESVLPPRIEIVHLTLDPVEAVNGDDAIDGDEVREDASDSVDPSDDSDAKGQLPGKGPGKGRGKQKGKGIGTPPKFAGNPPDLDHSYAAGNTDITGRGSDVNRKGHLSVTLARRDRSAGIQNYVQQLPPEFRQQVAEYYETLAQ